MKMAWVVGPRATKTTSCGDSNAGLDDDEDREQCKRRQRRSSDASE
jgi:hypothetical protein